ncbi:MAG TPA: hypothetical protein VEW47_17745, partial [Candidatus Dormibacteraeota bacterium]|nr:hypothetical protein [Candidatus Dormibacteraeota bacterium]
MSVLRLPSVRLSPSIIACVVALVQVPMPALSQSTPAADTAIAPGGFLESATTGQVRPRLSAAVLQALLPARGPFTFPPPYNTSGVRITNATD